MTSEDEINHAAQSNELEGRDAAHVYEGSQENGGKGSWFSRLEPSKKVELSFTIAVGLSTIVATAIALLSWLSPEAQARLAFEQRAWVTMTDVVVIPDPNSPRDTEVTFKIGNTGKTPAKQVRVGVGYKISTKPFLTSAEEPAPRHDVSDASVVIPQNVTDGLGCPITIPGPEGIAAQKAREGIKGVAYVIVFGRIGYRDVFDKEHITKFSVYRRDNAQVGDHFYGCATFNEIDVGEKH